MQPENSFDKLSKRLAVAVSRRSMLRSLSLAVAGALLPWSRAFGQVEVTTSMHLQTKFLAGPFVIDLPVAGKVQPRCVAAVIAKNTGNPAVGGTFASEEGACPTEIAKYFESSGRESENRRRSSFKGSEAFNVRVVDGQSRLLYGYPLAISYSFVNPITGKEEFEAYCSTLTYLDPRVHKGDPDLKMIHYKRTPIPKQLASLDAEVTCGDINYAYENEIKTRKPTALRNFADDTVPHVRLSDREKSSLPASVNDSGHKSK
jgi:hypothetical protein